MTTKFTPGPWVIAPEDKTFVYALGASGTNVFWAPVQAAGPEKASKEERQANANIIAAAPDLYATLVNLMELESRGRIMPIGEEWDAARAALAKARGEQ